MENRGSYRLLVNRSTAALYLAWEFGIHRAAVYLRANPASHLNLNSGFTGSGFSQWNRRAGRYGLFTRYAAEAAKRRVETIAAYQAGRIGLPLAVSATVATI